MEDDEGRTEMYTPEPWAYTVDKSLDCMLVFSPRNHAIAEVWGDYLGGPVERENARRIVACVNYCAGIPTDELEAQTRLDWGNENIHKSLKRTYGGRNGFSDQWSRKGDV